MISDVKFSLTTDASGDVTSTSTRSFIGRVVAVEYDFSALDATADITLSVASTPGGVGRNIAVFTNSQATGFKNVVDDAIDIAGAASGTDVAPVIAGFPKVVIAQGGNAASATVVFYIDDLRS